MKKGRDNEARADLERVCENVPDDPKARTLLGKALVKLGDYHAAVKEINAAMDLCKESPKEFHQLKVLLSRIECAGN